MGAISYPDACICCRHIHREGAKPRFLGCYGDVVIAHCDLECGSELEKEIASFSGVHYSHLAYGEVISLWARSLPANCGVTLGECLESREFVEFNDDDYAPRDGEIILMAHEDRDALFTRISELASVEVLASEDGSPIRRNLSEEIECTFLSMALPPGALGIGHSGSVTLNLKEWLDFISQEEVPGWVCVFWRDDKNYSVVHKSQFMPLWHRPYGRP